MVVNRTWLQRGVVGVLVMLLGWAAYAFSPERQVRKAFSQFIEAAGNRNWKKMGVLMAPDYRDQWGSDKEQALHFCSEGLQNFLVLQIDAKDVKIIRRGNQATVAAHLKIEGRGNPIGEMIKEQVNGFPSEFQFAWKRQSWKPWDWKLESMSQPELNFDPASLP